LKNGGPSAENSNPNSSLVMFQEQQKVWQEELRRADERSSKHRKELSSLTAANSSLSEEVRLLSERV